MKSAFSKISWLKVDRNFNLSCIQMLFTAFVLVLYRSLFFCEIVDVDIFVEFASQHEILNLRIRNDSVIIA